MKASRFQWHVFFLILLVYSGLILPTVNRQGISWDEQTDIEIARAYLIKPDGLFRGSSLDPSQTRLPAFIVAVVYMLGNTSDLITARVVSCIAGGLTILAVFLYGRRQYGPVAGLLAGGLLATSPFFLAFARVAFTETDIYLACAFAWLLIFVDEMKAYPSLGRSALVGVLLGLAMSAKFTSVVVFPAVWLAVWQAKQAGRGKTLPSIQKMESRLGLLVEAGLVLGGLVLARSFWPTTGDSAEERSLFLVIFSGWMALLAYSFWRRRRTASWPFLAAWITGLALLTFLVIPPEHLTNPGILQSLFDRFQYEKAPYPFFFYEATSLHILSVLFKSSLILGAGLLLSLVISTLKQGPRSFEFPVLLVWLYLGCLAMLPLAQTFYTIPVLPALAVITANQYTRFLARRRWFALGLGALAGVLLIVDLAWCYPDYNLNGYQWLGTRMMAGRPSIGYRSVVQTPSDGVEQVMTWLNENARAGERVRAYILPWHIVQAVSPRPVFRLENGLRGSTSADPDYVVVEINSQIKQNWWVNSSQGNVFQPPYDMEWLESKYAKIFTVRRAFGIEMASVYRKK
jgi:4-amino-4-deoxy-L-arabinose transferase-like glycosyltransferase